MSLEYLLTYWQPLAGLLLGVLLVTLYFYLYLNRNERAVPWIAKYIFRNQHMTPSADDAYKAATSYLLAFGSLLIIIALLYLTY